MKLADDDAAPVPAELEDLDRDPAAAQQIWLTSCTHLHQVHFYSVMRRASLIR
jgi:hypothetical protein